MPLRAWTLAAVVVSVFAVTAHDDFLEYRLIVPVLVTAGFFFSYWRRGKRNWWVKLILAALCLQVGWKFLRDVVADPYHTSVPLTVLLLWLQTLHSFDLPARRDVLFSLLSAVILMAVAAAFALDMVFLVYLAGFALAAVQALAHNAWQSVLGAVEPVAPQMPRAPADPGRTGTAVGGPLRGVSWAASHLLVLVLVGAGLAFVFTPRFEGMRVMTLPFSPQRVLRDLFAGQIANPAYPGLTAGAGGRVPVWNARGYFGFSANVDLRLRGRLDDTVVMRVRATRQFNWRGLVFDTYTGTAWKISDPHVIAIDTAFPPIAVSGRRDEVIGSSARTDRVIQSFYIDAEQPNVVFAAPLADQLYLPTGRVYVDRYGSMRLPNILRPGTVYSVISRTITVDAQRLRAVPQGAPRFIGERYLQLPPLPDRVHALAARLVEGQPTLYDRVAAVNRHLWTAYRYDLSIPPQQGSGDAVDHFLFEERRGYCEQFASAMVVLLRSVGIPARLVTGYTPGTLNAVTGLLEVRNSDAHAWVEVFFSGVGWIEFEPTPGFPTPDELGAPVTRPWLWLDLAERLRGRISALAERSPGARLWLGTMGQTGRNRAWALIALVGGLATIVAMRRVQTRAHAAPVAPIESVYREMCGVLARRGFRRKPAETVAEFSARVQAAASAPEVAVITDAVEAAAYGHEPLDPGGAEAAQRALDALRTGGRPRRVPDR
ncbi:MAG: transglutaminaseTgpA domain-containing protein [Armatimonadota bacterium]|nr:transglutaminaseTgpA domain-containing protein [Armatimonadota bacterium]